MSLRPSQQFRCDRCNLNIEADPHGSMRYSRDPHGSYEIAHVACTSLPHGATIVRLEDVRRGISAALNFWNTKTTDPDAPRNVKRLLETIIGVD